MVVAQREPCGGSLRVGAEHGAHALAQRLQRLEAGAAAGGVNANALGGEVVHGEEDRGLPLAGETARGVGAPHHVGRVRDDGAVVRRGAVGLPGAGGGEQPRLAHQAQHPPPAGAHRAHQVRRIARRRAGRAGGAQPRPDLAMALADERRLRQHLPDALRQLRVGPRRFRPPLLGRRWPRAAGAGGVDRRTRDLPHAAGAGQTVRALRGGRDGLAHCFDLRDPKGLFASARRARSRSSSLSIVSSPTFARKRAISSSRHRARRRGGRAPPPGRRRAPGPATARSSRP